jgi:PPOX class probable F420-dependent enzyme
MEAHMLGTPDQDKFISSQKWAVVTTLRRDGSPTNSVIFYARVGDELLFSTTTDRIKGKTIKHDSRVAVTVLDEGAPYRYVTVEGKATLHRENLVADHVLINRAMRGDPNWAAPEGMLERLEKEQRVVARVKAERVSGVVNRG